MDQRYSDNISKLSSTMGRLTDSIANSFFAEGFAASSAIYVPSTTGYAPHSTASVPIATASFVPLFPAPARVQWPSIANVQ